MKQINSLKSILMATGIAVAALLWMLSGLLGNDSEPAQNAARAVTSATFESGEQNLSERPRVTVQLSQAQTVTREIVVSARTEPNRRVELRAETDGRIVALGAERGSEVVAGELIVRLDIRDRNAQRDEAQAFIAQRELQYQAAMRLEGQQLIAEAQMAEARADLISAQAALERIRIDIDYTTIVAPFDAVLEERSVEIGDFVQSGDAVADLVDTDPLLIVGEISERDVNDLEVGNIGRARLVSGETLEGRIRYLSPVADAGTRTFRIELAVPNADRALRAGVTAEMRLDADEIVAHFLSPALLSLDDEGNVGVKSVDDFDRVEFYAVEIVSSSVDGITVTGLPDELRLITVGQGFVNPGRLVTPVLESDTARHDDDELSENKRSDRKPPGS